MNNTLTLSDYTDLKKSYDKAIEEKKESFFYKGNEILISFCKYTLQYMEMKIHHLKNDTKYKML